MKNTMLLKVWGIVLTLAIIAGLLMAVVPVSAGDLAFTTANAPVVTAATNANVFAIAADGKTFYMYSGILYKSNDAGLTWTSTGLGSGLTGVISKIIVNQTNASELLAMSSTAVFRSSNAGVSWFDATPTIGGTIYSIDEAVNGNGGVSILAATSNGVSLYSTDTGIYLKTTNAADMGIGWAPISGIAYGAVFSPQFANDNTVFALVDNGALFVRSFVVGGNGWNGDVADAPVATANYVAAPTSVSFAFPTGFIAGSTSTGKVFVGYSKGTTGTNGYVIRDNTKTQNTGKTLTSTVTDLQVGQLLVSSIAFNGAYNTGTLAVGLVNDPTVYSATSVGTATSNFTWNASTQTPYYAASNTVMPNTLVVFSPTSTALYAGTAGPKGSALSISKDYNSFAAVSFISVSSFANASLVAGKNVGAATQFMKMFDSGAAQYLLFKSIDTGATWQLIYNSSLQFDVNLSPAYATDSTIYLNQYNGASFISPVNKIVKSYDGGATWNTINVVGSLAPTAISPIDGTNYWVGTTTGIRASNSSTTVYLDGYAPIAIIGLPGCLLVWTADLLGGTYGEWWASTDSGATFNKLGAQTGVGNGPNAVFTFGFDGKNWTVYILDASMNIKMYTVGISTAWTTYKTLPATPFTAGAADISSINNNGSVWYISSKTLGIFRTTDFISYQIITGSAAATLGSIVSKPALTIVPITGGGFSAYTLVASAATATTYVNKWVVFGDILLAAPSTVAPAASAAIANNQTTLNGVRTMVDLSWKAAANATSYDIEVANDAAFTDLVTFSVNGTNVTIQNSTGTSLSQVSLIPGRTYYWRVRVNSPMQSYWSAGIKFSTVTSSSTSGGIDQTGRIYPTQGQVVTGTALTFTWGTVPGATSYEFNLIKDGTTVDSKTGLTSTVITETGLAGNVQYTWQVRAISNGIASDWVTSAFTTVVPATSQIPVGTTTAPAQVVTPIITVNYPTQPVQPNPSVIVTVQGGGTSPTTTPAWAWIVIAIGAVLVIAVIVLIVRTRKV